jgi:hypothetical protein
MPNSDSNIHIITQLTEDENGNLALEFPDEIIEAVDWKEGDTLAIEVFAGRIIFRKLSEDELRAADGTEPNQSFSEPM